MTLRNRVTPFGELIADPGRGLVYGNRGCLHDDSGTIRRRFNGRRWIACRLEFRGRRRSRLLQPGRYTELFFLDEATAMAAGHRPCAECRREDYREFVQLWTRTHAGPVSADLIDALLHEERLDPGTKLQRQHRLPFSDLPDGAFVVYDGAAQLVRGAQLLRWAPSGYGERSPRPSRSTAAVLTPPSLLDVLRAGWRADVPLYHPSAD